MITRRQLTQIHGKQLPLHILEQDYIQSVFLSLLYKDQDSLVFKGGTFLKHAYGLDRFSEDLDFTWMKEKKVSNIFDGPVEKMSSFGIYSELDEIREDQLKFKARLRYQGPLYTGTRRSMGSVFIEVSKRKDVFIPPKWTRLFFSYPGSTVVNVLGMSKVEILSEKLRALSTRRKGRDLYDVWFLLKQGTEPDMDLFAKKMKIIGWEPDLKISVTEEDWKRDLHVLLVDPPDYKMVRNEVERTLKSMS